MSPSSINDSFHRELASDPDLLESLVEETNAYLAAQLDDEDLIYRITLLISEAATNAMEHGNRFDVTKQVTIDLAVGADAVTATICDQGGGFVPEAVDDPLREENLLREGGRGLFLMQRLADEVAFDSEGRCVHLLVRRK